MANDVADFQRLETPARRLLGEFRQAIESEKWLPGKQIPAERDLSSSARLSVRARWNISIALPRSR